MESGGRWNKILEAQKAAFFLGQESSDLLQSCTTYLLSADVSRFFMLMVGRGPKLPRALKCRASGVRVLHVHTRWDTSASLQRLRRGETEA